MQSTQQRRNGKFSSSNSLRSTGIRHELQVPKEFYLQQPQHPDEAWLNTDKWRACSDSQWRVWQLMTLSAATVILLLLTFLTTL